MIVVRPEAPEDEPAIREVHRQAFARPPFLPADPPEVTLVDELRACPASIPPLSLVALDDNRLVGHVMATRAAIGSQHHAALGLGPLGVLPSHQRSGVGSALMRALLSLADDREEPVVVLLGAPGYYRRFGFALASTYGITPPDPAWAPHFQARPGPTFSPSLRGAFTYAEPFDRV